EAVAEAGGRSVNPPERSRRFTDKAIAHSELIQHGFGVPETVLLRPDVADRPLTNEERAYLRLGEPGSALFVKPANGFGQHGVVRVEQTDPDSLARLVAEANRSCPDDTLLLQREVTSPTLRDGDGIERPAYFRVLYCLGEIIPYWWSRAALEVGEPSYRRLTAIECRRHGLWPVLAYVRDLAELCGLDWFSTEVCLSRGPQRSRYTVLGFEDGSDGRVEVAWPVLAIDYVNDQCDVDVQSRWLGAPPDAAVYHLADRFAQAAASEKRRLAVPARPLRLFAAA
ncbi:MAG TPA: hypothetical protein VFA18_11485, partial [Gemmataceae bacterium]|nr:hypothetical protein [Gemmataceae bacterium]